MIAAEVTTMSAIVSISGRFIATSTTYQANYSASEGGKFIFLLSSV